VVLWVWVVLVGDLCGDLDEAFGDLVGDLEVVLGVELLALEVVLDVLLLVVVVVPVVLVLVVGDLVAREPVLLLLEVAPVVVVLLEAVEEERWGDMLGRAVARVREVLVGDFLSPRVGVPVLVLGMVDRSDVCVWVGAVRYGVFV